MSSENSASKSRIRSRWGPPPPAACSSNNNINNNTKSKDAASSISEEDAIAALISSAAPKQPPSKPHSEPHHKSISEKKSHYEPQQNSRHPKRHRRDDPEKNSHEKDENSKYTNPSHDAPSSPPSSAPALPKELANFSLSGSLAKDETTGNTFKGILLKFSEPPEARTPNTKWRLYVFKKNSDGNKNDDELLETLHISKQSAYLFGREKTIADIHVEHPSLSRQHCVLQYRVVPDDRGGVRCRPYLMDLGSAHGTFLNGERLESARYYEMRRSDVVKLGGSGREYVLLTENSGV